MIKVHISRFPDSRSGLACYILEYDEKGNRRIGKINKEGYLEFSPAESEETAMLRADPTFFIPGYLEEAFLNSMLEAINGVGVKLDKDSKIEGKLEATKYHLEDLRRLLKL